MRSHGLNQLDITDRCVVQTQFLELSFLGTQQVTHRNAQVCHQLCQLWRRQRRGDVIDDIGLDTMLAQQRQRAARIAAAAVVKNGDVRAIHGGVCTCSHDCSVASLCLSKAWQAVTA